MSVIQSAKFCIAPFSAKRIWIGSCECPEAGSHTHPILSSIDSGFGHDRLSKQVATLDKVGRAQRCYIVEALKTIFIVKN